MYCRNCGKEVEDGRELCAECAAKEANTEEVQQENVEKQEEVVEVVTPVTEEKVKTEEPKAEKIEVVEEIPSEQENRQQSNQNTVNQNTVNTEPKSKIAAGLFGIFLGSFGVHNFYLGYTGKAIAQLLISVLSCGILSPVSAIWGFIEGILVLTGDISTDANGVPLKE